MKRVFRGMKISGFCICVVASLWVVHSSTVRFFRIDRFLVQLDVAFSQVQKKAISDFFHNNQALKTTTLAVVAQRVREQFPSIKNVSLVQNASGTVTAHVAAVCPAFRINDDLVLTGGGCLFKKALFERAALDTLDSVAIPNIDQRCDAPVDIGQDELVGTAWPQLLETAQEIPNVLFQLYRVSCCYKACWSLEDKQQKKFLIFFNGIKMPDDTVMCACNKIKGDLVARGAFTGWRACVWVADTRFEDQIILFRKTGGR